MTTVEVVTLNALVKGGDGFLQAVADGARAAGFESTISRDYVGRGDIVAMYGSGSPQKTDIMRAHLATGRHVVNWDLGYFSRGKAGVRNFFRLSLDGLHPGIQHVEATAEEPGRFEVHGIPLREDYQPGGPVIVVGMGRKSREGLGLHSWEARTLRQARERFRGRKIIYRPKPTARGRSDGVQWPDIDALSPVAQLLAGASLVICRHSNVAVDACIAGVPVECQDGIARWLYSRVHQPTPEQRISLLRRAAWWQWKADEMGKAWEFLKQHLKNDPSRIG